MAEEKTFRCEVLTPGGKALSVEVIGAVVPLADGLMGFLAGRAPIIAKMGAGALVVHESLKASHQYFVSGGFAHMAHNRLSILAEECQKSTSLDPKKASELMEQAKGMPAGSPADRQRRQQALSVAAARLKVAESNL